jgi:hypothetical protein
MYRVHMPMHHAFLPLAAALVGMGGCAMTPTTGAGSTPLQTEGGARGSAQHVKYRCDQGETISVRFDDGAVIVDAGTQPVVLLRDAGGLTPAQTAYSSTTLRAEFGLGAQGKEAVLRYASPARELHCVRE